MGGTAIQAPDGLLVFRDGSGDYFLIPSGVWSRARVPPEERAEIEQAIAELGVIGFASLNLNVQIIGLLLGVEKPFPAGGS